jgi:hypothetical protein
MLDTTLKAILIASRRTKRDQQLKRFRYFKGGPEIGRANEQNSPAYVRCPTDHQNWHVILVQSGKLGEKMTNPMTDLDAYTDEELQQTLARVLAHARGEVLNDAEVQKFWQLYQEIQRRALSVTAA